MPLLPTTSLRQDPLVMLGERTLLGREESNQKLGRERKDRKGKGKRKLECFQSFQKFLTYLLCK